MRLSKRLLSVLLALGLFVSLTAQAATFTVGQGGTGRTTFTSNAILKGNAKAGILASGISIDSSNNISGAHNLVFGKTQYVVGPTGSGADCVADGTADDVEINSCITTVNALGGGTVKVLPGTYLLSEPVQLRSNVTFAGSGLNYTIIKAKNGYAPTVRTSENDGVAILISYNNAAISHSVVSDITWDGNESNVTPTSYLHARNRMIYLANVSYFTFERNKTLHPISWTFQIKAGSNVHIRNNEVYSGDYNYDIVKLPDGGQDGFDVSANNVWIEDNYIDTYGVATSSQRSSGDDAIVIRQGFGSQDVTNVVIARNIVRAAGRGIVTVVDEGLIENVKIIDNVVEISSGSGIYIECAGATKTGSYEDIDIAYNTIVRAADLTYPAFPMGGAGIFLDPQFVTTHNAYNVSITNNRVLETGSTEGTGKGYGIFVKTKTTGLNISDNFLDGLVGVRGISIGSGEAGYTHSNVTMKNNTVNFDTASGNAVVIDQASKGVMSGNKITGPGTGTAINVRSRTSGDADDWDISHNTITSFDTGIVETNNGAVPDNNQVAWNVFDTVTTKVTLLGTGSKALGGDSNNWGFGLANPSASFHFKPPTSKVGGPNPTQGSGLRIESSIFTDSSTAGSGTATAYQANSLSAGTLAATNSSVTTTDAATLYIAGAVGKATNNTVTNTHGLFIAANAVGAQTNSYGLTVNAQTGASANYAAQFLGGSVRFGAALIPTTNDGAAIGSSTLQFSDFYVAEGGTIDWDNGDAVLTQAGDVVTLTGANLGVTNAVAGGTAQITFTNNGAQTGVFGKESATYAGYKTLAASDTIIYNGAAGNITLLNDAAAGNIVFAAGASSTAQLTLTSVANLKLGGTGSRGTTEGTNQLVLFNGTAPAGTLTNGGSIYAKTGEIYTMDAAGNETLQSPHDLETNEWIFYSKNTRTGKVLRVDMERLIKAIDEDLGGGYVQEYTE